MIRKRQKNGERTRRTHISLLRSPGVSKERGTRCCWLGPSVLLVVIRKSGLRFTWDCSWLYRVKARFKARSPFVVCLVLPLAVMLAVVLLALARSSACFSWRALFVVVFISSLCKTFIEIKGTLGHLRSETWSLLSNCWHSDITPYATIAIPAPMNKCMMKCTGNQAKLPSLCRRIDKG